jgi:IS4 transposase
VGKVQEEKGSSQDAYLIGLRGSIPSFIAITDGKLHDVNILDILPVEANSIYVMDRAYVDFARLYKMNLAQAYFVVREKQNFNFRRVYSNKVDKEKGFKCDQIIVLTGYYTAKKYPEKMRRIKYYDEELGKTLVFLTNILTYSSEIIAQLYKERWKVELFFKWIKQHLRIKNFYGTTYNAVCTQIWTAVSVYLLVAIMKKRLNLKQELYTILQILSICMFEKVPLNQLFKNEDYRNIENNNNNQLKLFDL